MLDRKSYEKLDYTLCLLSTRADGKAGGCIINSLRVNKKTPEDLGFFPQVFRSFAHYL